ncbi:MAG TPA: tetratricopeptide repeat protein [candidate division Zixibacteria bacterium]|jgi:tetratricopeptide (TPR) repeat protein
MNKKGALRRFQIFLFLFISFYFLVCGKVIPKSINWVANFEEASRIAKSENKNMVLDFYTDWCKWCKKLADSTFTDTSLIRFSMDFVFFKTNAEKDTALAEKYKINGYPSVILTNPSGEEIDRVVGYANAPDFMQKIKDYLKGEGTLTDLENKHKKDTTDIELWFKVGDKYQERRRFEEALINFNKVVSLDPKDKTTKSSEALLNMGFIYSKLKNYPSAIEKFQEILKQYPKSKVSLKAEEYIPYTYATMGDTVKAVTLFKKILKDHPDLESGKKDSVEKMIKKLEGKKE